MEFGRLTLQPRISLFFSNAGASLPEHMAVIGDLVVILESDVKTTAFLRISDAAVVKEIPGVVVRKLSQDTVLMRQQDGSLWLVSVEGCNVREVRTALPRDIVESHCHGAANGRFSITVHETGKWEDETAKTSIWLLDRSGERISTLQADKKLPFSAGFSPDGRYLMVEASSGRIFDAETRIYDVSAGRFDLVCAEQGMHPRLWLPDPTRPQFLGNGLPTREDRPADEILLYDVSSRSKRVLAKGVETFHMSVSPDGRYIALPKKERYPFFDSAAVVEVETGKVLETGVTNLYRVSPFLEPVWSPSSKRVLFRVGGRIVEGGKVRGPQPTPEFPIVYDGECFRLEFIRSSESHYMIDLEKMTVVHLLMGRASGGTRVWIDEGSKFLFKELAYDFPCSDEGDSRTRTGNVWVADLGSF